MPRVRRRTSRGDGADQTREPGGDADGCAHRDGLEYAACERRRCELSAERQRDHEAGCYVDDEAHVHRQAPHSDGDRANRNPHLDEHRDGPAHGRANRCGD